MTCAAPGATHGIVLFAHGARDPAWAQPFEAIATLIRKQRANVLVELAFLELMQPDLETAIGAMARLGVSNIDVVPIFMAAGSHLKRDLPVLVEAARAAHPMLAIRLHEAVGEHLAVQEAIATVCLNTVPGLALL